MFIYHSVGPKYLLSNKPSPHVQCVLFPLATYEMLCLLPGLSQNKVEVFHSDLWFRPESPIVYVSNNSPTLLHGQVSTDLVNICNKNKNKIKKWVNHFTAKQGCPNYGLRASK